VIERIDNRPDGWDRLRLTLSAIQRMADGIDQRLTVVEAATPSTPAPTNPTAVERYQARLTAGMVRALGAVSSGTIVLGTLPTGCYILTLSGKIITPFVSSASPYTLSYNLGLVASPVPASTGDSDPYSEGSKILQTIGTDAGTFPTGTNGYQAFTAVNATAYNVAALPARIGYPISVVATMNEGNGNTMDTYTAGEVLIEYVVIRPTA
jgi:hypothetical protein